MKNTYRASFSLAVLAGVLLSTASTRATVTFLNGYTGTPAEVSSATQFAYAGDVSASDLLHGIVPSTTGWNTTNEASPLELTDGIHGVGFAEVGGDRVQGAWTTVGATAIYNLGTGANGLGFDLTSLQSIADWQNVGFGNQGWTLAVQTAGSGSFVDVATVDYQALGSGPGTTKVTIADLDVTGAEVLRVTANQVNGGANAGAFVWRELDVFGADTVPEPSSMALLGLGGLLALRCRRRP